VRIALVQQHATTDKQENLERGLRAARSAAERGAQVIAFAELTFEPFYPQDAAPPNAIDLAEPIPGLTTQALAELAGELGLVILPNLYEQDGELAYDTTAVIDADGTLLGKMRMLHIPDYPGFHERGYYAPGDLGAPVFETRFGRIGVAICYDRHYPEVMRALALAGAQVVIVPQAGVVGEWPDGLFEAEMRVASFHNGFFTALCNRVGAEARLTFAGGSFVCNPTGKVIARAGTGTDEILIRDLDLREVGSSHARRQFLSDRRPALYKEWTG
jgi:predicted amidohydrolase